jgi:hypothetical protein
MWIELRETITGLFFPSETLPAGAAFSIGGPRGRKLISQGKAIEVACPSGDPDDLDRLRRQYKEANNQQPLWDEQQRPSGLKQTTLVTASALRERPEFAQTLVSSIERKLGPRAARNWRERAAGRESRRGESVTTASELFRQAAKRLAAGRSVTTKR